MRSTGSWEHMKKMSMGAHEHEEHRIMGAHDHGSTSVLETDHSSPAEFPSYSHLTAAFASLNETLDLSS